MADTKTDESTEPEIDEARSALLDALRTDLGDALVDSHLLPGKDLWIRVNSDAWASTAGYLRNAQQFRFFNFLSAIDWLPSPFGRSHSSAVDVTLGNDEASEVSTELGSGYAGGETRFQAVARVHSLKQHMGITIKADFPEDTLSLDTWTNEYPGANWHEREAAEMFGVRFAGHPGLSSLYLPSAFEGHPLRKDFPLLSRMVKPWPGIVDVEPMPEVTQPEVTPPEVTQPAAATPAASTDNPEDVPS